MLTGRQIREARRLLGWDLETLARRTGLAVSAIDHAEAYDGEAVLGLAQEIVLKHALTLAGLEFIPKDRSGAGVRLRGSAATEPHE